MRRRTSIAPVRGLVLLGLLLVLALAALLAVAGADVWATVVKREREAELLFVGDQYRRAIESYWRASPGAGRALPKQLSDLLEDRRFPMPVRHLRRAYADPMGSAEGWGLVRVPGGIAGVYSTSEAPPLKRGGFPDRYTEFETAKSYREWRFVAEGQHLPIPPRAAKPAASRGHDGSTNERAQP